MDSKEEKEEKEEADVQPVEVLSLPYQLLLARMMGIPLEHVQVILQPYETMIEFTNESFPPVLLSPQSPPQSPLSESSSITESDSDTEEPPQKRYKTEHPPCLPDTYYRERTEYRYLLLSSGKEFYFNEDEGEELLTPLWVEPNPFIRKILSRLPYDLNQGLLYLNDFMDDSQNVVIDVDRMVEKVESKEEASTLDLSTIFTNLREQLVTAYLREQRLRRAFRGVLQRWRMYQIDNKHVPEVDPITLSTPEKEVHVYDLAVKKKFTFEARTLANYIETKLAYNEGGFAAPIFPKNPWTNADFTYYQLLSIYYQLKSYGELRWGLVTLQKYHFDLNKWHTYHRSTLTLQSIKNSIRLLDSVDARDVLEDFILLKLEDCNMIVTDAIINAYRIAMRNDPNHWYLQYWKEMAWVHYESDHFSRNRDRYIQSRCEKIVRYQTKFLNELVDKKWIRSMP
jgi:hypothetical protein